MTSNLLPCPFCNAVMSVESNQDWHRIVGDHDDKCVFTDRETLMVPATDEQLALAIRDWSRRATQPADGEPFAWIVESPKDLEPVTSVCKRKELAARFAFIGWAVTPVYAATPVAAHGDEAVRKLSWAEEHEAFKQWARSRITPLKLDLDEVGLFYDEVAGVAHDAWHARAAMRAQGDGETESRMIQIPEMTLQRWASRLEAGGTHGWEDRLAAELRAFIAKEKAPDVTLTIIHEDGEPAGMQVHFSVDFDVVLHNLPPGAQVHLQRIGANPSGEEP